MITNLSTKTFNDIFDRPFNFWDDETFQAQVEKIKEADGSFVLNINALGHDPDDIDIDITSTSLKIKSAKPIDSSKLINSINLNYKLGPIINHKKIEAEFKNGILIISIPIRGDTEDITARKLKIKS